MSPNEWRRPLSEQQSLFSVTQLQDIQRPNVKSKKSLVLSQDALADWTQKLFRFQSSKPNAPAPSQRSLLMQEASGEYNIQSDKIVSLDPFALPQQNTEFWRWTFSDPGEAALYFVIDAELPVLLYVGETCQANKRWKGVHGCKQYLMNYVELHRRYNLPVSVRIAFWQEAPRETKARQALEQALIQQWRSPFNKENWKHWGTPFLSSKP